MMKCPFRLDRETNEFGICYGENCMAFHRFRNDFDENTIDIKLINDQIWCAKLVPEEMNKFGLQRYWH